MNSFLATLALFLIADMSLSNVYGRTCCFDYVRKQIPMKILKSFHRTSGWCKKPGVIFITNKNIQLCADPNVQWVQDRMRELF